MTVYDEYVKNKGGEAALSEEVSGKESAAAKEGEAKEETKA